MAKKADADRAAAEASLSPDQRHVFRELLADYKAAADQHVPGYGGGISAKIAAALVQNGWRKQPPSN